MALGLLHRITARTSDPTSPVLSSDPRLLHLPVLWERKHSYSVLESKFLLELLKVLTLLRLVF
jgi:hypothetical protein